MPLISIVLVAFCIFIPLLILSINNGFQKFTLQALLPFYFPYSVELDSVQSRNTLNTRNVQYFEDYVSAQSDYKKTAIMLRAYSLQNNKQKKIMENIKLLKGEIYPKKGWIVLGEYLGYQLGVGVGDSIELLSFHPGAIHPFIKYSFKVGGIVSFKNAILDKTVGIINKTSIPYLFGLSSESITHIGAYSLKDFDKSTPLAKIQKFTDRPFVKSFQTQRYLLQVILISICLICFFATFMTVNITIKNHLNSLALLKHLGLSLSQIYRLFLMQGIFIAVIGSFFGLLFSIIVIPQLDIFLLAFQSFIDGLVSIIKKLFPHIFDAGYHFKFIPEDVFYNKKIPIQLKYSNFAVQTFITIVATLTATIVPSKKLLKQPLIKTIKYKE